MVASSCGTHPSNAGVTSAAKLADSTSSTMNTPSALRAMRPEAAALLAVLTPTITSAVTSGTTVICRALSHSRPMGRATPATCKASVLSNRVNNRPSAAPSSNESSTLTGAESRRRWMGVVMGRVIGMSGGMLKPLSLREMG